jgi:antitoxin YefM
LEVPVPRIRPSSDVLPVTQFRANASSILEQLQMTRRPIVLTQHGRSAAVLLDVDLYEALIDKIEELGGTVPTLEEREAPSTKKAVSDEARKAKALAETKRRLWGDPA